jgi:hypothetical protein
MSGQLEDLPVESNQSEALFTTVNMLDPQLAVKSTINFSCEKSAQNITYHSQGSSSATNSGINFSLIVPSLSTVISRKVMLRTQMTFTLAGVPANGKRLINWGIDTCLAPFAIHQCIQNMNVLINSSSFTFDCRNNLDLVLRTMNKDVLEEYANTTPVFFDNYGLYSDAILAKDSPFTESSTSAAGHRGRGSYPVTISGNTVSANGTDVKTVTVTVDLCEPLVMSPFLMSTQTGGNSAGIYGVQSMDATINFVSGQFTRALRTTANLQAGAAGIQFAVNQAKTYLDFVFMTPHASLKLPARNVIPYLQLQNSVVNVQDIGVAASAPVVSNTYQLNMIPDSVMICCRKKASSQTCADADCYLPFAAPGNNAGGVSINFANTPGILAGNTITSLHEYSNNAGTVQDWISFNGVTTRLTVATDDATLIAQAGVKQIPTTGPILNLKFGSAINLVSDWNAPSSIGNFSFQISCNVYNNTGQPIVAGAYELICVFVNSSIIVNSLGSTSIYSGLLTKQDVLDATTKPPVNSGEYKRMYGGGWWDGLKSAVSAGIKLAPHAIGAYKAISGGAAGAGMASGAGRASGSTNGKLKDRFY